MPIYFNLYRAEWTASRAGLRSARVSESTGDAAPGSIECASSLLVGARRVTVLAGAGISTDSGIPDFRGPNGLWTRDPEAEKTSDIRYYTSDPAIRRRAWLGRIAWFEAAPEPNAGHRALAEMERRGRLHTLITQNIDGLHQAAGNDPGRVVEIHGTVREVVCLDCGERQDMAPVLDRVRAGEEDPDCRSCSGMLKSATVSFGQSLDPGDLRRAFVAAADCDVFLAVGTSLGVYPIAESVQVAADAGASVVICNAQPTPYDDRAAAVIRKPLSNVLPMIAAAC